MSTWQNCWYSYAAGWCVILYCVLLLRPYLSISQAKYYSPNCCWCRSHGKDGRQMKKFGVHWCSVILLVRYSLCASLILAQKDCRICSKFIVNNLPWPEHRSFQQFSWFLSFKIWSYHSQACFAPGVCVLTKRKLEEDERRVKRKGMKKRRKRNGWVLNRTILLSKTQVFSYWRVWWDQEKTNFWESTPAVCHVEAGLRRIPALPCNTMLKERRKGIHQMLVIS